MSSINRLCLESDSDLRQWFSERICDDLSQLILQYLPLKDRNKVVLYLIDRCQTNSR